MDSDPAYKAAVEEDIPEGQLSAQADSFMSKYVHSNAKGAQANLQRMRAKLDDDGNQAVTSSAFNRLRQAGETGRGFSQAAFNDQLAKINAKPELIGNSETLDELNNVGEVARLVQRQSRGSYFNNSNTFVAAAKDNAASAVEGAANAAALTHGVPAPVGTWGRSLLRGRADARALHETLKPGAGLAMR
jgi:hypothetical protein